MNIEQEYCYSCNEVFHLDQLDSKPKLPETPMEYIWWIGSKFGLCDYGMKVDWTRLQCKKCYGPGWLPTGEEN